MKWHRLYSESGKGEGETKTIPVQVSTKELKLVQNYLRSGKPLNDPQNRECLDVVVRILKGLVENSELDKLDIYISNWLHENLGIEVEIDPYGENSAIQLGNNGLIPLTECKFQKLSQDGAYADLVQGGFWNETTGELEEGFIEVEDLNLVLDEMDIGNGVKSIHLKQDGDVARIMIDFE